MKNLLSYSRVLLLACGILFSFSDAWAVSQWVLFGDASYSQLRSSNLSEYQFKYGSPAFGGGLGAIFGLSKNFSFEIDVMYVNKNFLVRGQDVTENSVNARYIEVPLIIKANLSRFFSLGGGVYLGRGLGPVKITYTGGEVISYSYADASLSANEFGVLGAGTIRIPLSKRIQFFTEARYLRGFKNIALSVPLDTEVHYTDIRVLLGITIGLESRFGYKRWR